MTPSSIILAAFRRIDDGEQLSSMELKQLKAALLFVLNSGLPLSAVADNPRVVADERPMDSGDAA